MARTCQALLGLILAAGLAAAQAPASPQAFPRGWDSCIARNQADERRILRQLHALYRARSRGAGRPPALQAQAA